MKFSSTLLIAAFLVGCSTPETSSTNPEPAKPMMSIKAVLLKQLHSTHYDKNWFVSATVAIEGLTAKQASWKDASGNHSAGQLVHHLVFWNERLLKQFNGEPVDEFKGNNTETFDAFTEAQWETTVKKLHAVMGAWEEAINKADEAKLNTWYENIANLSTHNAYHVGQIVFQRKLQGNWDEEQGVK